MAGRPKKKATDLTELAKFVAHVSACLTCAIPIEYWKRHVEANRLDSVARAARDAVLKADVDGVIDRDEWRLTIPSAQLSSELATAIDRYQAARAEVCEGGDALVTSDGGSFSMRFDGEKLSRGEIHWRMAITLADELYVLLALIANQYRAKAGMQPIELTKEAYIDFAEQVGACLVAGDEAGFTPSSGRSMTNDRPAKKTRRLRARAREDDRPDGTRATAEPLPTPARSDAGSLES